MGLKEQIQTVIYEEFVTLASSLTVTRDLVNVPRGAKATIKQLRIAAMIQSPVKSDTQVGLLIARTPLDPTAPDQVTIPMMKPIWQGFLGLEFFVGGSDTADIMIESPSLNKTVTPPVPNHGEWSMTVKGAMSNSPNGWTFGAWEIAGEAGLAFGISVDWELEWLETSRSQEAEWTMDQMVEEECC